MPSDPTPTPRDRGICGAAAPHISLRANASIEVGYSVVGTRCVLMAEHPGWHRDVTGMSWTLVDDDQAAYARGIVEGRRQATEGWKRRWADILGLVAQYGDEREAVGGYTPDIGTLQRDKATAALNEAKALLVRITELGAVGPWETAEQPDPARCCDLHGRNCEQGGEECCERCTEAHHFEPGHGGVPCSAPDLSALTQSIDPEVFRRETLGTWRAAEQSEGSDRR